MLPQAAHARQVVLELGQLDLQLSLRSDGVLREDVEDELGPVDDPELELVFQASLLTGGQVVVDDDGLGGRVSHRRFQLDQLPFPDVGPRVRGWPTLDKLSDR